MAILKYRNYDDPIYQKPVQEVNDNCLTQVMLNQILQDMVDTHFQEDTRHGVGLAANQIGYLYSIFLTHISPIRAEKDKCDPISLTFWANASFKPIDEELAYNSEGCFSVPGCMGKNVKRYAKISVSAEKISVSLDQNNKVKIESREKTTLNLSGFPARLFQHEIDHINSIKPLFYFDHLENGKNDLLPIESIGDPRTKSCP